MRDIFPGYYRPTGEEFTKLWKESLFVFDTNVLLHVYRYSAQVRDHFLDIVTRLQERLWIPYQVAFEYQRGRVGLITDQEAAYNKVSAELDKLVGSLEKSLQEYRQRHEFIDVGRILKALESLVRREKKILDRLRMSHPDRLQIDPLRDRLDDLFAGRIGSPLSKDERDRQEKEALQRIKRGVPPGQEDSKKADAGIGDALIWLEILAHAKTANRSVLFVTDDAKSDWWLRHSGRTIGPRPELVQELYEVASQRCYFYSSDRFIEEAARVLSVTPNPEAVKEARSVRTAESVFLESVRNLQARSAELSRLERDIIARTTATQQLESVLRQQREFLAAVERQRPPNLGLLNLGPTFQIRDLSGWSGLLGHSTEDKSADSVGEIEEETDAETRPNDEEEKNNDEDASA